MKIILSIISMFFYLMVNSQNIDWIRSEYGFDNISDEGLQILLDNYNSEDNLFVFTWEVTKRQPYKKINEMFHEKFKDKLSTSDLYFLGLAWDRQNEKHIIETKARVYKYRESYECQKKVTDSLRTIYEPILSNYDTILKNTLNKEQKTHLLNIKKELDYSIQQERNQYVGYHQRMTIDIDSFFFKYFDQALNIMDEFPNTRSDEGSFNLNYSKINFIYNLPFEQYYSIYYEFETKLVQNLYRNGCKQIDERIPDYSEDINSESFKKASIRNSIFYFLNKHNFQPIPLDTIENRFNNVPIISTEEQIEAFLDLEKLKEFSYFKSRLEDYSENSYLKNKNGHISLLSFTFLKSIEEKNEIIKTFNNQSSINYFSLNNEWYIGKKQEDFTIEDEKTLIYSYLIFYKGQLVHMLDIGSQSSELEMLNLIKSILK